jgi:TonB family protein
MKTFARILLISLLVMSLFVPSQTVRAQNDTIFYGLGNNGRFETTDREVMECFALRQPFNEQKHTNTLRSLETKSIVFEYECYDKKIKDTYFDTIVEKTVLDGKYQEWYLTGERKKICFYIEDELDSTFTLFYRNGKIKRKEQWAKGEMQTGKCFDETGKEISFFAYEQMPQFPGGESALFAFLGNNIKYPNKSRRNNSEGKALVKFVVETDGRIVEVTIQKSVDKYIDREAIRVVKAMPKWKPGTIDGIPVRVYFNLPIKFRLED